MDIVTHCLALPEILENIFSYIIDLKDFINLLKVNYIWQKEGAHAILKLYRKELYHYKHNILYLSVLNEMEWFQLNKIYEEYDNFHYINFKEEYERIQSVVEYNIINFEIINNILLSSTKLSLQSINIMEKIVYLKNDYRSIEDKIAELIYNIGY